MSEPSIIEQVQEEQVEDTLDDSPRKLASITTIASLHPIPGADRIEIAKFTTSHWQCIVGRGEFKAGDKAVFFEIDSFLPKEDRYAILEGRCNKILKGKEGYRIRSMKMRGELSQGFCMPVSAFEGISGTFWNEKEQQWFPESDHGIADYQEGHDVTHALGVKLWQMPVMGGFGFTIGRSAGGFPTHLVPKTDQERIQNMSTRQIIDMFIHDFEVTEKLHGTSCTMAVHTAMSNEETGGPHHYEFKVCSRNLQIKESGEETITYQHPVGEEGSYYEGQELKEGDTMDASGKIWRTATKKETVNSIYWDMARKYKIQERLTRWCQDNNTRHNCPDHTTQLAIQGEICGPGINKNPLKLDEAELFVFDIYDINTQRYLNATDRYAIIDCLNAYEDIDAPRIPHVPVLGTQKISPDITDIERSLARTKEAAERHDIEDTRSEAWKVFMDNVIQNIVTGLLFQADDKTFTGQPNREGLVFKSIINPHVSFKVISNSFLCDEE
jgi:RNA ligase (TIGR02306 family)